VAYRSSAAYGAQSKGWSGILDISDAINRDLVTETVEQVLTFFD
jgi:hypothetical protein